MADKAEPELDSDEESEDEDQHFKKLLRSYLGVSFGVFLALVPRQAAELRRAEEQLRQMSWRRREDAKANARVVEIFAGHRNAWQAEEKWLLHQIDAANQEIAHLNASLADLRSSSDESGLRLRRLEADLVQRDRLIGLIASSAAADHDGDGDSVHTDCEVREEEQGEEEEERVDSSEFLGSKVMAERAILWQDVQYESDSMYDIKHFVARRESPWKVDGESTGVSSKLKLLEQELINLEKVGRSNSSKAPSLMRKQAKRYQALTENIDDLCKRMQESDPCEAALTLDFRTQRQTEFLLEAFRLQQRTSEIGQKLTTLQTEIGKSYGGDVTGGFANFTTKRSLDSIGNNFKDIQRNMEIWLARIIGDLEGILSRDGASRVREYYISGYPLVQ